MATASVSPFAAPALLLAASALLASLPAGAERAARWLTPAAAVLAALLAIAGTRPVAGAAVDALARLAFLLVAVVVAGLAVAASLSGPAAAPVVGLRLRVARGVIPGAGAAALLAASFVDAAASLGALAVLALACAVLGAIVHGPAAGRDAAHRIVLASVAGAVGWLGLLVVEAGSTGPGALLLMLAAGALGAAPPFASGWSRVAARLPGPLAGVVLLLPPLAAAPSLLRARAAIPAGSGAARLADTLLLLAGLAALVTGAIAIRRSRSENEACAHTVVGLWGPALFGWGLGSAAGLQAGFAALVFAALAGFALLEAMRAGPGAARTASLLAAASLPPFGGFAALVLLAEATLPTRPVIGVVFLCALAVFALAVLRPRGVPVVPPRGRAALLTLSLALSVLLGVAMPAPLADALSNAAGLVAGGGG